MKIESEKSQINKSASEVFSFLTNFNNFQKLMPEQVMNWESNERECSFTISGMASIGMKIVETIPNSLIRITSNGKVPFNFSLNIHLQENSPSQTTGQLIFESDVNPMMAMMIEKPLTTFFNLLSNKMQSIS